LLLSFAASAVDLNGLVPIGPMAAYTASGDGITITCTDQSQVRFQVLAADLIRVRASFGKPLPERDHSWAIDKTSWEAAKWTVREDLGDLLLATDDLEVVIRRSPLLVEFRDSKTHRIINADARPMAHDPAPGGPGSVPGPSRTCCRALTRSVFAAVPGPWRRVGAGARAATPRG
jgi:hypothetical protein